jgi:uncharacterized protein (DUF2062 family)
MIILSV